jgi:hypothetical protein
VEDKDQQRRQPAQPVDLQVEAARVELRPRRVEAEQAGDHPPRPLLHPAGWLRRSARRAMAGIAAAGPAYIAMQHCGRIR